MNKAQEDAAYYAVITAPVRYDPELSSTAKLLYCEITSLCRQKGYCWAKNSYFSELFSLSTSTISRMIAQLERRGHIKTETVAVSNGSERRIYTDTYRVERDERTDPEGGAQKAQAPSGGCAKTASPPAQKAQGGVGKNGKQNDYHLNDLSKEYSPCSPPRQPEAAPEGDAPPPDKPKPKSKRRARRKASVPAHAPERFEQFWEVYPGGGSRLRAVAAWDALAPDDGLIDEMARALKRQMASSQWRDGVGIPHASTWLNQQRWTDKLPEAPRPQDGGWARDPEVSCDG